jgi:hypothetical protein
MPDSARDPAVQALVKGVSEVWAEPSVSPLVVAARVADAAVTHP